MTFVILKVVVQFDKEVWNTVVTYIHMFEYLYCNKVSSKFFHYLSPLFLITPILFLFGFFMNY